MYYQKKKIHKQTLYTQTNEKSLHTQINVTKKN